MRGVAEDQPFDQFWPPRAEPLCCHAADGKAEEHDLAEAEVVDKRAQIIDMIVDRAHAAAVVG